MSALIERGQEWKVKAQTITDELATTPMWVGKIRFPGRATGCLDVGIVRVCRFLAQAAIDTVLWVDNY